MRIYFYLSYFPIKFNFFLKGIKEINHIYFYDYSNFFFYNSSFIHSKVLLHFFINDIIITLSIQIIFLFLKDIGLSIRFASGNLKKKKRE
jgi:hypothetical protein